MEKLLDSTQLGAIIKQRRKESGMTQEVAAAFCGVTKKTLLKVEKGGDVYLSTVLKIINGLGIDLMVTTSELASGDGEQSDWF